MSNTVQCDNCGDTIGPLDENGEIYAWVRLSVKGGKVSMDACTMQCAHELLDGDFREAANAAHAPIAEVSRVLSEGKN